MHTEVLNFFPSYFWRCPEIVSLGLQMEWTFYLYILHRDLKWYVHLIFIYCIGTSNGMYILFLYILFLYILFLYNLLPNSDRRVHMGNLSLRFLNCLQYLFYNHLCFLLLLFCFLLWLFLFLSYILQIFQTGLNFHFYQQNVQARFLSFSFIFHKYCKMDLVSTFNN